MPIEKYLPKYRDPLLAFYQSIGLSHFHGPEGTKYWDWRSNHHCQWFRELGFPVLYTEKGEILGSLNAFPNDMSDGREELTSFSYTDFYVRDSHRGVGPFLIHETKRKAEIVTCTNGPPEVLEIFSRLGFLDIAGGNRGMQKRLRNRWLSLFKQDFSFHAKTTDVISLAGTGLTWSRTTDTDRVSGLGRDFLPGCLKGCRSAEFLEWRVLRHPVELLEMWILRDQQSGDIGYLIFARKSRRAFMPFQALIFDFAFSESCGMDELDFIMHVETLLISLHCDIITFFLVGKWSGFLEKQGYECVWRDRFLVHFKDAGIAQPDRCHFTVMDTEKFLIKV